ncbi:MAG: DUF378 domain-containing protein [Patescibacteria group bacterium]
MIKELTVLDRIALILVVIGGLNWGLIAISPMYDLIQLLLGSIPVLAQLVYLLVGVAAIYVAVVMMKFARK